MVRRVPQRTLQHGKRLNMSKNGIFDLTGKVAAVIGGASGIGAAVTKGAADMGATVYCLDLKADAAA